MTFESFTLNAGRLEAWAHSQLSLTNTTLPLLLEVAELKKLSGILLEKGPFEELMMDIYACLFESVVPELIARAGEAQNREKMRIDRMLMDTNNNQSDQASAAEATVAPSRPKQVSKAEVRRRSEALVTRVVVPTVRTKAVTARATSPDMNSTARFPARKTNSIKKNTPDAAIMHDSADAESELSSVADSDMEDPGLSPKPLSHRSLSVPDKSMTDEDAPQRDVSEPN